MSGPSTPVRSGMASLDVAAVFRDAFAFVSVRSLHRLDGLTDDECLWEPAPDCWTVRCTDGGVYRADSAWPPPDPEPITTIAWRIAHIGDVLSRHPLRAIAFERETAGVSSEHPHDADTARSFLVAGIADWTRDLESIDDERLAEPMGAEAGPYAQDSVASFVLHIHTEFVHHSAEVALLRDLHRASATSS
jgi:hypothetical protein